MNKIYVVGNKIHNKIRLELKELMKYGSAHSGLQ
jgi:hypothetical protein